jgi:VIT1/CCC1 family predicted Fe2+/Mn2+ transporter
MSTDDTGDPVSQEKRQHPHIPPDGHHRDVTGGALRAGVFGAMDGMVSNFALVAGVIGGGANRTTVVLTGLAGLAAGAFSMAVGEYTSVRSQEEATLSEIEKEKLEIERNPIGETAELALIYQGYGVSPDLAEQVAHQITTDPEHSWRVHAREELGIDPDDLPSPYVAAGSSFVCFALGALVPILTFLLGIESLLAASAVSAVGLFATGAVVSRLATRSGLVGGLRQLVLGSAAAALTYGVGNLIGAGLG